MIPRKKFISILLSVILTLSCCLIFAGAKTSYNAAWSMTGNVNGTSYSSGTTISVIISASHSKTNIYRTYLPVISIP